MIKSTRYAVLVAVLIITSIYEAKAQTPPDTILIPAGEFIMGSDRAEREAAYKLDEAAYGHSRTRQWKWYEDEPRRKIKTDTYAITSTTITNRHYLEFIRATGHPAPNVTPKLWKSYGLIHPFQRTRRHAWSNGEPPKGRLDHPVVMVNQADVMAYAKWLSQKTGAIWRLPTETEWEKAARGSDGRMFPWGDTFDPALLNSHDAGPFDTLPVGQYEKGKSPFGLMDAAGQVFEWTGTPGSRKNTIVVKGGSWDDSGCGVCRPAARHTRPASLKHILIGFRLIREP